MKDLKNDVKILNGLLPQAMSGTTDIKGEVIDRQGFDSVTFAVILGATAASSLAAQIEVQESDTTTDGDFTAVADADLIGTELETKIVHGDDTNLVRKIGYKGTKRYCRMVWDISANNGTDVVGGVAILGHAHAKPVA
jgi:hypothetical protein